MKKNKLLLILATIFLVIICCFSFKYYYDVHLNYNFKVVSPNKVFKSGVIPPEKISAYADKYNIKTIIDLRHGKIHDKLNPASTLDVNAERMAVEKIKNVNYINIPSRQIPNDENLSMFFNVLDNEDAYPVLIHCHHGFGRAMIYSAIYLIEYENWTNDSARRFTRSFFHLPFSSFAENKPKGAFLINYKKKHSN